MLYVILNVLNAMDARLKLPPQVRAQNVTAEHWEEHGRRLAGTTPIKYNLPPDMILNQLRDVLGSSPLGKRPSPDDSGEPSGTTDRPDKAKRTMQSDIGVRP